MKFYNGTETTGYVRYRVVVELEFFGDDKPQTKELIEHQAYTELEECARERLLALKITKEPIIIHGMEESDKPFVAGTKLTDATDSDTEAESRAKEQHVES